ncbi:hypothetical protein ALT721_1550017 [Alteromonas alvinellae]
MGIPYLFVAKQRREKYNTGHKKECWWYFAQKSYVKVTFLYFLIEMILPLLYKMRPLIYSNTSFDPTTV